jgi:hypothetical protein
MKPKQKQKPAFGRIIKMSEMLPRRREATPLAFRVLKAWPEAMRLMYEDAIGVGEAYTFSITEAEMEEHGFKTLRSVVRPIKKYVKTHYPSRYQVRAMRTSEGPTIFICRPSTPECES